VSDEAFPRALSLAVHELRTPVTVVAGYIRMVLKEQAGPLNEKQRKMLEEAERSCGRISELVNEMSEMSKLESGQLTLARQDVDLAQVLTEVAANMQEGHDRGVLLEVRGTDAPVVVSGDRTRLLASVKALLYSALREQGEPTTVVAQLATVPGDPGSWAVLAVSDDNGVKGLIESARTTPPAFDEWRGGLGMALPVGRRVIEALGGALWSAAGERPRAGSALRLPLRT
jgi:signal transduction histidine kinase